MNARIPILLLLLATGLSPGLPGQQHENNPFSKTADLPGWHIKLWEDVIHYDHPYFAQWSAPLGDTNGDGYDDFAIATGLDTTFIFLGGDPFDHEPAYFVYGGSAGINSGDFNGDGRMDLVTARRCQHPADPCPENRGQIRIYYQRTGEPAFGPEPDLLIEGGPEEYIGAWMDATRPTVQVLDFNGDGYDDIVTPAIDKADSIDFKAVLYFGGAEMDAVADLEFTAEPPTTRMSDHYVSDILVGDLNGDGCDDLLINGSRVDHIRGNEYWRLYLGNRDPRPAEPDRVLREIEGWVPAFIFSAVMDVDSDGYADIVNSGNESLHRPRGDVLVFRSGPELPVTILPNDSIPNYNPDPLGYQWPQRASPVGDMNGDGTPDLMMPWQTYFYPGSSAYFFHPGGPDFRRPSGFGGTVPEQDFVKSGMYDVGDVNGDGYDDVVALGKSTGERVRNNCFQLRLGSGNLLTSTARVPPVPDARLMLSPNPLPVGVTHFTVRATGLAPGYAELSVRDLLGRELGTARVATGGNELTHRFDAGALGTGAYLVTIRQGRTLLNARIIVE
ncbi:MAG: T9SS type A sorting domain-containing protein [Bacteroidetes bacterium]|nr:T9SS type A sorting domain-containing protein [Bacteroidota bacterium]